jgi:hypothetical protein
VGSWQPNFDDTSRRVGNLKRKMETPEKKQKPNEKSKETKRK